MRIGKAIVGLAVFGALASFVHGGATALDSKGRYNVRTLGIATCTKYLEDRNLKKNTETYADWMMGFITAYNWLKPDTFEIAPQHGSTAQLLKYFDLYCGKNPKKTINEAAVEFVSVVYAKRQKVGK